MSQYQPEDRSDRDLASDTRSPEDIEREIERTRERMGNNIDALGEKLSPERLKQQAKDAIAEKAQDVVINVGEQARETGSRVIDFITQNPLPVAAASLGAIWLVSLRRGHQRQVSGDRMARFAYTGAERREPNGTPGLRRRLADRAGALRDTVGDAASRTGEKVGELKERVQERAGELKERVQEQASELGLAAGERTRRARGGLEHMMEENPLAVVAGATVIGLALGMLLPETDPERRVMGGPRDQLADRVSNVASRAKDAAVEAGRELQATVRDEVENRGPELKNTLKDAAENVKEQIQESAGRIAQEAKQEIRQDPSAGRMG
jgi:ElaB/YqjD/DUF883 family membrane-anchored ribosome-binding protein